MRFGNVELAPSQNQELVLEAIRAGAYEGFADIPAEEYFAAPYASQSFLWKMRQSPAHAMSARLNPKDPTPALQFGTWAHLAVLEREYFQQRFTTLPRIEDHPNAIDTVEQLKNRLEVLGLKISGKKADLIKRLMEADPNAIIWDALVLKLTFGKTALKPDDYERLQKMATAVAQHPTASRLLSGGRAEVSMFSIDPETGVRVKGRMDYLQAARNIITDYKTSDDASFEAFQRSIATYGYHWQTAYYTDLYAQLAQVKASEVIFAHIVGEKDEPFPLAVYTLDEASIEKGRMDYREMLRRYAECERTGTWPAYDQGIMNTALPSWSW
jgi:hypothetical protein